MKHYLTLFIILFFFSTIAFSQANKSSVSQNLTENKVLPFIKALPIEAFANTLLGITDGMKDSLYTTGSCGSSGNYYKTTTFNNDFVEIENKVSGSTKERNLNATITISSFNIAKTKNKILCVYTHFNNFDYMDFWEYDQKNDSTKKINQLDIFPEINTELFFGRNIDKEIIDELNKQKKEYDKIFSALYEANEDDANVRKNLMDQYYNPTYKREPKIFDYSLDLKDKTISVSFNSDDIANKLFDDLEKTTNFITLKWSGQKFKISNK